MLPRKKKKQKKKDWQKGNSQGTHVFAEKKRKPSWVPNSFANGELQYLGDDDVVDDGGVFRAILPVRIQIYHSAHVSVSRNTRKGERSHAFFAIICEGWLQGHGITTNSQCVRCFHPLPYSPQPARPTNWFLCHSITSIFLEALQSLPRVSCPGIFS